METTKLSQSVRAAMQRALQEHSGCRREIQRLAAENARLADELSRARARNEDLTRSAEIWIRMYESHLVRSREARPGTGDLAAAECRMS